MKWQLLWSSVFIALCPTCLATEHYVDGEHNVDYDREAFFGDEEELEEFAHLSPEEQKKRLIAIVKKIDSNSDGFISEDELSTWIQMSFRHYATEETVSQFPKYDLNQDGIVSWEEYNIHMYNQVLNFDENTVLKDPEEESFRLLHLKEKKRFEKANVDEIPGLNLTEFVAFENPTEVEYMMDYVIQDALEEHDKDGDGFISLNEFLGDYRRDPGADHDAEWAIVERERFENVYDKNKDGKLNNEELLNWMVPNNLDSATEEAFHLIKEMDLNDDGKLTEAEILNNQELFISSEATDYGRQLHDKRLFHDEL
ncbi:reticulocalbin-2 [Erpetoichthys calabaricus]|uniref:Reticulocalbin 2 n=1 Tax=Erpetoichthys calabaricus TaxID=27687 RepID=A0A8C4TE96_ERPCA|nr:reticulocalbin-2 [Erpetoichthys calabaricus]XP_028678445.1 reticulocalbin-2 [Erpetoichthys calabaricus]